MEVFLRIKGKLSEGIKVRTKRRRTWNVNRGYINERDESETQKMNRENESKMESKTFERKLSKMNRENESKMESKTFERKLSKINAKRKMVYVSPPN